MAANGSNGYDAVVIGGGHNGLVAATYLAKAGLRTVVLERREVLGGATLTTELAPGVRVPTLAHTVGRLRPSVVRDLSILVDSALPAAAVRGTIRSAAPETLVDAIEFDRYRGKGVPDGRVSLSLRLTFRSNERTLTDTEVDAGMNTIVAALAAAHGAVRR